MITLAGPCIIPPGGGEGEPRDGKHGGIKGFKMGTWIQICYENYAHQYKHLLVTLQSIVPVYSYTRYFWTQHVYAQNIR